MISAGFYHLYSSTGLPVVKIIFYFYPFPNNKHEPEYPDQEIHG